MIKFNRNMSELWQIMCKNIILAVLQLLILLCELFSAMFFFGGGGGDWLRSKTKDCKHSKYVLQYKTSWHQNRGLLQ